MNHSKYLIVLAGLLIAAISQKCSKAIIDEGPAQPQPVVVDEPVAFNPDVQQIMYNNCQTCHSGAAPSSGVDLTTYDNVKWYTESGSLLNRINSGVTPMPPSGLMSAEDRAKIQKWADDGFPEN